jgi:hypothetical protein
VTTTGLAVGSTSVYACATCAPGFYGAVSAPGTAAAAGCAPCPPGITTAGLAAVGGSDGRVYVTTDGFGSAAVSRATDESSRAARMLTGYFMGGFG